MIAYGEELLARRRCWDTLSVRTGPCTQVASILHSLDAEGSAESEAVLEEAFATTEGVVEPVEEGEAEARLLSHFNA